MNPNHASLLARLDRFKSNPRHAAVRASAEASLANADRYAGRRNGMGSSGQYTESGVNAAMRDLLPATLRSLQTARSPIAAAEREGKAKQASLLPAEPDKSDFAGAIQTMEIRRHLQSLKPLEREALLMSTTDLRLIEAAVTAPPELSGFTGNYREIVDKIERRYTALTFPAEMAELESLTELLAEAEAIVAVARNSIRDTAKLEPHIFEAEAKKIEAAVWLLGDPGRERVCEVGPDGTATYRSATPDDVASGVRYADVNAYHAARAA